MIKKTQDLKLQQLLCVEEWLLKKNKLSFTHQGILITPSDDVNLLINTLSNVTLVVIDFGNFDEGRGYSQIRLLRKKIGYEGKIKAINVHIDHLQFIIRSGIDSYELLPEYKKYDLDYAMDFNICYQLADNNTGLIEKHKLNRK